MRATFRAASPKFCARCTPRCSTAKANAFPALYLGSKVPWLGSFMRREKGGTIRGRMLIPLLPQHQRIGPGLRPVIDA